MQNSRLYFLAWFDIALLFVLYFLLVWVIPKLYFSDDFPRKLFFILLFMAGYYFLFQSPKIHNNSLYTRGLGEKVTLFIKTNSFKKDAVAYGIFALFCAVILTMAIFFKLTHTPLQIDWNGFFLKYILYFFSASIQDVLFFSLLLLRIRYLVQIHTFTDSQKLSRILTTLFLAAIFGLAHWPNWPLASWTFFFAFGLGWIFYARPNLFLVVMCHAFFGVVLHRIYQLHMKFGLFYGQHGSEAYFIRKIIPGLEMLIGNKW